MVSLAYAAKNSHLMAAFDVADYCQDIVRVEVDQLVAQVREAASNHDELTRRIEVSAARSAGEAEDLLHLAADSLLGLPHREPSAPVNRSEASA